MCTKRRSNVGGCRPDSGHPFLQGLGDELRVIVGTNVLRDATQEEEIGEHVDDIDGFQLSVDSSGSTSNQRMTAPGDLRPISNWLARTGTLASRDMARSRILSDNNCARSHFFW